jgi:hypothetical protein
MPDPVITCPYCKSEIKLTESLAAPLLEAVRLDYEARLQKKDSDVAHRERDLRQREETLSTEQASLDAEVASRVKAAQGLIAAEEARKAKQAVSTDLEQKAQEITDLQDLLKSRESKLADAQKAEAQLIRDKRALDDAKRELELTIEKRVQENLDATRQQGRKEAEDQLKLSIQEYEQTIVSMKKQIEDLKKRAEQGSQQLQGEVQELELENLLRLGFPHDTISPVPKGEHGGDVLQDVGGALGRKSGTILWESKRTKSWSDDWLAKLRDDQRNAKADVAVLTSQALPRGVESFDFIDGIWVAQPRIAMPLATVLRQWLIQVSQTQLASEGKHTKMDLVYEYLTGSQFRQRVQAIVEAFSTMQEDLEREKKAITKQWAKRAAEIERVMRSTVGMYGDLQGIAGKTLQEIEGLSLPALEGGEDIQIV